MQIIKIQKDNQLVEIEVESQAAWDALSLREQHSAIAQAIALEKSEAALFESVMKGRESAVQKAKETIDAYLTKRSGELKLPIPQTVAKLSADRDPDFERLYDEHSTAQRIFSEGDPSEDLATVASVEKALQAEIDEDLAQFQVQHNIVDKLEAQSRLTKMAPRFAAKLAQQWDVQNAKAAAITKAQDRTNAWHRAKQTELRKAAREQEAVIAAGSPAEQALSKIAKGQAQERGVSFEKAMEHVLLTDPAAQALYEVIGQERKLRSNGGN